MSTFLRDQLAGVRINRIKQRVAQNWAKRQREADPVCPDCGKRHPRVGLVDILQALGRTDDDEAPQPDKAHH